MVIYLNANTIEKYSFEAQNRDNVGHYGEGIKRISQ